MERPGLLPAGGAAAATVLVAWSRNKAEERRLVEFLTQQGFEIVTAPDGEAALNAIDSTHVDAVIADARTHRIDGLNLLDLVRRRDPEICFILISETADLDLATEAIRRGAHDFQVTPLDHDRLLAVLGRGISHQRLKERVTRLEGRLERKFGFQNLIGNSSAMVSVFDKIQQIAPTRATVLITGETGTGKELVATALHYNSPRRDEPFVKLNCAALAEGVIESELFGHEQGAFTSATRTRKGRFEIADGGTVFLDEITEITPPIQAKLLRVLQEREFERVGGSQTFRVDVRLIAATNRNLEAEVKSGRFREDLYYRLNVVTIELPPLRGRREDIPLLVEAFIRELNEEHGKKVRGLTKGAMDALRRYHWPGNVRELKNAVEGMVLFAEPGQLLGVDDMPEPLRDSEGTDPGEVVPVRVGMTIEEAERRLISATYRASGANKQRAATTLGIGLRTLYRKLKEYDLD
jgi:DNA-binding NtrC family response regulator